MMENTSGLLLTDNKDGSLQIGYEDYGTYNGMDYECTYTFDVENGKKLRQVLKQKHPKASLHDAIIAEVGENVSGIKLEELCFVNDIQYDRFVWIS